jgi:hypothetical protein
LLGNVYYSGSLQPYALISSEADECINAVSHDFFSQVSQIIPLLLVALGIEARIWHQQLKIPSSMGRVTAIVAVIILCIAEIAALFAVSRPNIGCYAPWQVFTFGISIQAVFVGLVTLIWFLVWVQPEGNTSS